MIFHTRIVRRDQPLDNGVWQRGPDIMVDDLRVAHKTCAQLQIIPENPPGYPDDYTQDLINDGLLERAIMNPVPGGHWEALTPMMITEKGRAFLRMIFKTPLPVEVWVDPRTKEIV